MFWFNCETNSTGWREIGERVAGGRSEAETTGQTTLTRLHPGRVRRYIATPSQTLSVDELSTLLNTAGIEVDEKYLL